jgi:hypothetical protein
MALCVYYLSSVLLALLQDGRLEPNKMKWDASEHYRVGVSRLGTLSRCFINCMLN